MSDADLIMISALQHAMFCQRQYALIHLEQIWEENRFTAEGEALHERVHRERHESRRLFREEYGMSVRSLKFGLIGKCDLAEIWLEPETKAPVRVNPVEFKRGRSKTNDVDRVQLCAQALCLEEAFNLPIGKGEFYYLQERRRVSVDIDEDLRAKTISTADQIRAINASKKTPVSSYEKKKCDGCSLIDHCMPRAVGSVSRYVRGQIEQCLAD
ncbi:MAG: CRISPR-associated protein Cas4 [Helicobacteraceae bacterium]|jgi:CRISPR-associated exonuclease Cas4|nr:CRISPR-associated protein Cas4 [Helicobacteraceae bacterium]